MALELKQQLRLSQQLVMTPQLQQAIKLLQLSRLELVDLVQQELQENPVLEEALESDEDRAAAEAGAPGDAPEAADVTEATAEPTQPELARDAATGTTAEATDAEKFADVDWQNYARRVPADGHARGGAATTTGPRSTPPTRAARRSPSTCTGSSSSRRLPVEEEIAARFIIGNLDDHGYLRSTLDEIARQAGVREERGRSQALARVQEFDPPGVAARDLRECLLLQLARSASTTRSCCGSSPSTSTRCSSATSAASRARSA